MSVVAELLRHPVCGMTWGWVGTRGTWGTVAAAESMARMAEHAVTWTALAYATEQEHIFSTDIPFDGRIAGREPMVSDDEIVWAIREAHGLGLKVCLKPVVNVADGTWRAHIGFFDHDVPGEPTWAQWFDSYRRFILHAAAIAEAESCEMLCIGCEMVRADGQEAHWRALIAAVREVYSGPITYNCDKYQEDRVTWWDCVDVVSSSGYYPIDAWQDELDRIETAVAASGKPFFFMEAGCPSREGSAGRPNDWALPGSPSVDEQLSYYRAMFEACRGREWVRGLMLWDWPAQLYPPADADDDDGYCPYGKPAADLMAQEYAEWAVGAPR